MGFFYDWKEELAFNAMKQTKQFLSYISSEQRQRTKIKVYVHYKVKLMQSPGRRKAMRCCLLWPSSVCKSEKLQLNILQKKQVEFVWKEWNPASRPPR